MILSGPDCRRGYQHAAHETCDAPHTPNTVPLSAPQNVIAVNLSGSTQLPIPRNKGVILPFTWDFVLFNEPAGSKLNALSNYLEYFAGWFAFRANGVGPNTARSCSASSASPASDPSA